MEIDDAVNLCLKHINPDNIMEFCEIVTNNLVEKFGKEPIRYDIKYNHTTTTDINNALCSFIEFGSLKLLNDNQLLETKDAEKVRGLLLGTGFLINRGMTECFKILQVLDDEFVIYNENVQEELANRSFNQIISFQVMKNFNTGLKSISEMINEAIGGFISKKNTPSIHHKMAQILVQSLINNYDNGVSIEAGVLRGKILKECSIEASDTDLDKMIAIINNYVPNDKPIIQLKRVESLWFMPKIIFFTTYNLPSLDEVMMKLRE